MSTIQRALYCKLGASANTAYNLQFAQCELRSRTCTMYLQLLKLALPYSTERMWAAIGDISTIHRVIYYKLGANTACNFQFTQCELWSRTYKMNLQLLKFRGQYSTERVCVDIGDMSTIQRAIYCKLVASANTAYNLQFTQCEQWSRTYTL
jgi:hypothetical protein